MALTSKTKISNTEIKRLFHRALSLSIILIQEPKHTQGQCKSAYHWLYGWFRSNITSYNKFSYYFHFCLFPSLLLFILTQETPWKQKELNLESESLYSHSDS